MKITINNNTEVTYKDISVGEWFAFKDSAYVKIGSGMGDCAILGKDGNLIFGVCFTGETLVTLLVPTDFTFEADQ